jgi:hypothetical protein
VWSISSSEFQEVIGSVITLGTSRSSTRKSHLKTSIFSYQQWAGQTSPIPCILSMFRCEVCLEHPRGWAPVHRHPDQTLPDHLPPSATLRTIFTRYLNINAVPRYGFFEILHHFAENSLEREKLQEFITPEGAVRFISLGLTWTVILYLVTGGSLRVCANGAPDNQGGLGRIPLRTDTPRLHLRRVSPTPTSRVLDRKFDKGMRFHCYRINPGAE